MGSVNCVAKLPARLDGIQRRQPVLGYPIAVVYKFFDDQGNYLSATLTYYAFIAIFPLLLIASSVLGFLLHDNPPHQRELLDSGLSHNGTSESYCYVADCSEGAGRRYIHRSGSSRGLNPHSA